MVFYLLVLKLKARLAVRKGWFAEPKKKNYLDSDLNTKYKRERGQKHLEDTQSSNHSEIS